MLRKNPFALRAAPPSTSSGQALRKGAFGFPPLTKEGQGEFITLLEAEQQELAWEILRRTVNFDLPAPSDEELVLSAEELFLELDRREAQQDEQS